MKDAKNFSNTNMQINTGDDVQKKLLPIFGRTAYIFYMRSWRKQMKTVFLVAIYCILLVSCKKEKAIPFVLESGMPCITLTFSNSESNKCELCFGIDTG